MTFDDSTKSSSPHNTTTDFEVKAPASTCAPVSIETSTLTALKERMTGQSTIYRRHEARLARSYALRDDPRPALIRVLSGLPGFRMIVPPYQSKGEKNTGKLSEQIQMKKNANDTSGAYSEETIFARYSGPTDNDVGTTFTESNENTNIYFDAFGTESAMQAMLATGVCSGAAEYVFSYCSNSRTRRLETARTSPFLDATMSGSVTRNMKSSFQDYPLFFHHKASMVSNIAEPNIYKDKARDIIDSVSNFEQLKTSKKTRPSNDALSKAICRAFPISLLFGAKMFLNSSLKILMEKDDAKKESSHSVTSDTLSSTIAGGVVGLGHLASLRVKRRQTPLISSSVSIITQQQHLTSGYSHSIIGRNIVAAVLYFSIYDGVSTFSPISKTASMNAGTNVAFSSFSTTDSDSNNERKGTVKIAMGGALAGLAYAAVMNHHRYGHYGSTIWWRRIMLPAASRAAPMHALIFFGYEKVKEGLKAM